MAKLDLECPCGFQQTFRCELDDNARHLAELHGWKLIGTFICPQCARDFDNPVRAEKRRRADARKLENHVVQK